jgi:hypothetical protein
VTGTIALDRQFITAFGGSRVPPVTGFAIEADTTQVREGTPSAAWIKSVKITH